MTTSSVIPPFSKFPRHKRPSFLTVGLKLVVLCLSTGVLLSLFFIPGLFLINFFTDEVDTWWQDMPSMPVGLTPLAERSVVLDANNVALTTLHEGINRERVELSEISPFFIDAVIATEDQNFYEHEGANWLSIARAAAVNLREGGVSQGASTITQQLVKLNIVGDDLTFYRKFLELRYAIELEHTLSKDEILERYLNQAYFGRGVYGVSAAAEFYWGVSASDLNLNQSAILAGMLRAPESSNVLLHPDRALSRRNIVLNQMLSTGSITQDELSTTRSKSTELNIQPIPPAQHPFFVEAVKEELLNNPALGSTRDERRDLLYNGGLRVESTLDPQIQRKTDIHLAEFLQDDLENPVTVVLVSDPSSGAILGMSVGPKNFGLCPEVVDDEECDKTTVNPAVPNLGGSGRSTGSAFKPIVAAGLLMQGNLSEDTRNGSANRNVAGCMNNNQPWRPSNYGSSSVGFLDLYTAMRVSNNLFFADAIGELSPEYVASLAKDMGFQTPLQPTCSLALGGMDVFPSDLASAYGTLVANGTSCEARTVSRILDRNDNVVWEFDPEIHCTQALDRGVAARVVDTMRGVFESGGTASAWPLEEHDAAGKTGTSSDHHDAWFVGFNAPTHRNGSGSLVTAVWMGYETPAPMRGILGVSGPITGGSAPARLWNTVMNDILQDSSPGRFTTPPSERISVPNLVGLAPDQVELLLERLGLQFEFVEVNDYRSAGIVVAQSLAPDTVVNYRSFITLEVSNGLGELPLVPDVVGLARPQAVRAISQARFEPVVNEHFIFDSSQFNRVVFQYPTAGSPYRPGNDVVLSVGVSPWPQLPDVSGMSPSQARIRLRQAGYVTLLRYVDTLDESEINRVVRTGPWNQASSTWGGVVVVYVGRDARIEMPDVSGSSEHNAVSLLQRLGFVVDVSERSTSSTSRPVLEQNPAPGTLLAPGSTVSIVVGRYRPPPPPPPPPCEYDSSIPASSSECAPPTSEENGGSEEETSSEEEGSSNGSGNGSNSNGSETGGNGSEGSTSNGSTGENSNGSEDV